ncbi:3-phosphoshikimate 1-carboxyvinyltransferase [Antarcticibacterium arcticum]|uniref:3-phosphoshikimate 1-carboxyvinyltransferase n=1 Tax=Antarcticibacterium arcticum TaxID=2585771 RepID=A0A5B8YPS8_9FLAO|nr:3-phosphoshikimate 1-carboxyvinyltransferase [Antarcticibacterium arcticum]QED37899.1 3-phosphoshikimate 1-carboxyvinyltransferase [Antarcticibacterium arcticum]
MNVQLSHSHNTLQGDLEITGSKSESNRMLILQAQFPNIILENLSNSDDTRVLQKALATHTGTVDIHHAGTAMRFLTAYYAALPGSDVILTGSGRMKERPVKLLVDALRSLGADIDYLENEGFPPLKIKGKKFVENTVGLKANISSQYISALMLIAPSLPDGLEIILDGQITSVPYITMTLDLLTSLGIKGTFQDKVIRIEPASTIKNVTIGIESDWSSASYFYSLAAICETAVIRLSNYRSNSLQGDSCLAEIYKHFGVFSRFKGNTLILEKNPCKKPRRIHEDLKNSPDIAQTIAVTCLALGVDCELAGLHTLKIKETDRLVALKTEMEKFGAKVEITQDNLKLKPPAALNKNVLVSTYNDHRMAMAFAPLGLKIPLGVEDADVVSKSYPEFWEHLEKLGFKVEKSR